MLVLEMKDLDLGILGRLSLTDPFHNFSLGFKFNQHVSLNALIILSVLAHIPGYCSCRIHNFSHSVTKRRGSTAAVQASLTSKLELPRHVT